MAIPSADDHVISMARHRSTATRRMTAETGTGTCTLRRQQRRTHEY
jgi:hypothetical protein